MVTIAEIDSFTSKFRTLLYNGLQASLSFESKEGEAFVVLKASLGSCIKNEAEHHPQYFRKSRGPSYYRRQEKRRIDKLSTSDGALNEVTTGTTTISAETAVEMRTVDGTINDIVLPKKGI